MLDERDVTQLLQLQGREREELFARARRRRHSVYRNQVVVRGVCEVTNLCRVDCEFCPMRRANTRRNDIYQLGVTELVETATTINDHDISVIMFQGGEIPQTTNTLTAAITQIRALYRDRVEILLNLGNKRHDEYAALREALAHCPPGDVELTLTVMAVMRLVNQAWLIPTVSALETLSQGTQRRGFDAGANVIGVNFTNPQHRGKYLIYGRDRRITGYQYARSVLADAGLVPAGSVFVAA
jgi:biotin synthase-like enzyme